MDGSGVNGGRTTNDSGLMIQDARGPSKSTAETLGS